MLRDPKHVGPAGWNMDKLLLQPLRALDLLDEYETHRREHNRRVNDLIEANNRYLNEARCARDEKRGVERELVLLRAAIRDGRDVHKAAVLDVLRDGKLVTAAQIAKRIGVSERSVHRYMDLLRADGHSIAADAGVGYILRRPIGSSA